MCRTLHGNTLIFLPREMVKYPVAFNVKYKYRGIFETQKSGNKTSLGEIGLNIRTYASPKVGQDQVSGEVRVLCWHTTLVYKFSIETSCNLIKSQIQ